MDDPTVSPRLDESEELHRITLQNISDAVFITDDDGAFTYICPNADVIFGYVPHEVWSLGRISVLLGKDLVDRQALLVHGELRNIEHEIVTKSGARRVVLVHVKRVAIRRGTTLYVCRDITDRRESEEALRQQLRFEALISELSAHLAGLADADVIGGIEPSLGALGEFLSVDRAALWDIAADRRAFVVIGMWCADGVPPVPARIPFDGVPLASAALLRGEVLSFTRLEDLPAGRDRTYLGGEGLRALLLIPISMGGSWVAALSLAMVRGERAWPPPLVRRLHLVGEMFGAALARQRSAEAIAETRAELFHVSRLSVAGELTAAVAHEIRQPLTSIAANAAAALRTLEHGGGRDPELREILTDIASDNRRASDVISRLGELLRKHRLERRPLDVNAIVTDVVHLIRAEAGQREVTIDLDLSEDLPVVSGDRVYLQQVLLNLLMNGMDSMRTVAPGRRQLMIRTSRRGAVSVAIDVSDRGHGLADDVAPRIFDPFFTTRPHGTGLGLAIARSIIEAHGGAIQGENRPGGGATFRLTIPAGA